jgi:transporter family protein
MNWFIASLFALLGFGLWGFFTKLAVLNMDSKSALVYQTVGVAIIGFFILYNMNFKPAMHPKSVFYAVLTGAAYGVGCLFYFIAASKGKIITVVTLTALYPLVTIFLGILLLKEGINIKQGVGIIFACVAILLMAT